MTVDGSLAVTRDLPAVSRVAEESLLVEPKGRLIEVAHGICVRIKNLIVFILLVWAAAAGADAIVLKVKTASAGIGYDGRASVTVVFSDESAEIFRQFTAVNVGRPIEVRYGLSAKVTSPFGPRSYVGKYYHDDARLFATLVPMIAEMTLLRLERYLVATTVEWAVGSEGSRVSLRLTRAAVPVVGGGRLRGGKDCMWAVDKDKGQYGEVVDALCNFDHEVR